MRTINLRRNKKGVSPIIATLLLIVIAVAAAVVTYAFVTGFIGTATSQSTQQGAMSIDTGNVVGGVPVGGSTITVYVRNTGTKAETLTTVYVDNVLMVNGAPITITLPGAALAPGATGTVSVASTATNWANGAAHTIKVVASDGTPVAYSVHS
jgi:flagellin-like protein